ncbi:hypothetical protein D3C83_264050 [compost metagenome]
MARGLGGAKLTGIAKDRKDIAQNGIGKFGVSPRRGAEMSCRAGPMVHIFEHIE